MNVDTNIVQMKGRRRYGVDVRPLNCTTNIGEKERCPHCGQFHLRLGYCQAFDAIHADRYPHLHQSHEPVSTETRSHGDETETDFEASESQPWVAEGISRATYFRRKREAKG